MVAGIIRKALSITVFSLLAACHPATTYSPAIHQEELAAERLEHERLIAESMAQGGTVRPWRSRKGMRQQFERVAERIEEAGAELCRGMGIARQRRCYYYFSLANDRDINAAADGESVVVNYGVMRFIESDDELALVMAHELAHNLMGHPQAGRDNATFGALVGLALDGLAATQGIDTYQGFSQTGAYAGQISYSVDYEKEADYVGLYIMARAGYDTAKAAEYWRRFSVQEPDAALGGATHPSNPERFVALRRATEEIEDKRRRGMVLLPEIKKGQRLMK